MTTNHVIARPDNSCTQSDGVSKSPKRRITSAEKAARQEKRLRDLYGNSLLDPKEPPQHGFSAAAILCAMTLLRQAFRSAREFKPRTIADKVAGICSLTAEQRATLLKWLTWAKPRRWVLQEEGRSAVVAWSASRPANTAVWTAALDARWRGQIQEVAASIGTETPAKDLLNASGQPCKAVPASAQKSSHSGEKSSRHDPMALAGAAALPSHHSVNRNDTSSRLDPVPQSRAQQVATASQPVERKGIVPVGRGQVFDRSRITKFPYPAYNQDQETANKFASAADKFINEKGSAEDLKTAAANLLKDIPTCRVFCERSPDHRSFLESIVTQLGWKLPC
jgi:hypothetical protein